MPEPTGFEAGDLLAGKYRVERAIGSGGMGIVLAARHEQLATKVAIKLLRTEAMDNAEVLQRFLREARAAVSLRSEHIARVFDVGELPDGRPYIVMEHLEGQDLGGLADEPEPVPVGAAVDYVVQASEAIAEAHAAGIVHRDLKPSNLFLTRSVHGRPFVKVLDFGISKSLSQGLGDAQLTKTSDIVGSPAYMSPEQLRCARDVDHRTDIWGLGVILYELLTGRVPFTGETMTELILAIVTEPHRPIRPGRSDVPPELEAIIDRCLAKEASARFPTVVELVTALEPFAEGAQATATDRVRAVASAGKITASRSGGVPAAPSPVQTNGTLAWGKTQASPAPAPAGRGQVRPLHVGVVLALGVVAAGGGWLYSARQGEPPPAPPSAAGEEARPALPPGRKDLPPAVVPAPPASTGEPALRRARRAVREGGRSARVAALAEPEVGRADRPDAGLVALLERRAVRRHQTAVDAATLAAFALSVELLALGELLLVPAEPILAVDALAHGRAVCVRGGTGQKTEGEGDADEQTLHEAGS